MLCYTYNRRTSTVVIVRSLLSNFCTIHFRPQRSIDGLPVTLHMLSVKSDKSDWLRIQSEFSAHAQTI